MPYFIESGRKRRGVEKVCPQCNKSFVGRKHRECCSQKCAWERSRKRDVVICSQCSTQFEIRPSQKNNSKSGLYFCNRKCKDEAQRLGGIREIMPPHYGTAKVPEYRNLFSEEELVCSRCGYNEFSCAVDIHHIDHDRSNNKKENLIPLCSNCHKGLHWGKWERDCPKV